METNQPDPPYGVRGQLNSRFEQHTIGYLRPSPMRHWDVHLVALAKGLRREAEGE